MRDTSRIVIDNKSSCTLKYVSGKVISETSGTRSISSVMSQCAKAYNKPMNWVRVSRDAIVVREIDRIVNRFILFIAFKDAIVPTGDPSQRSMNVQMMYRPTRGVS